MNRFRWVTMGLTLASLGAATAHAQETTMLLCQGSGSVLNFQTENGSVYDYKTHSLTKSTSRTTTTHRPFSGSANVEINGGSVRMKLPHELVPNMSSPQDGWFTLEDPFVGDKEITGTLHLNAFNKPKVNIDRMTGQLSLASGFQDFSANCTKIEASATPKF